MGLSQYGMERFIGWILGRLNARKLAAASLFKNALLGEAYKSYFRLPFTEDVREFEEVDAAAGFEMRGKGYTLWLSYECDDDCHLLGWLRSYLQRKYDGMSAHEAGEILDGLDCCTFYPRLRFNVGSDTLRLGSFCELRKVPGTGCKSKRRLVGQTGPSRVRLGRGRIGRYIMAVF